jgi:hypothetical protein
VIPQSPAIRPGFFILLVWVPHIVLEWMEALCTFKVPGSYLPPSPQPLIA